MPSSPPRARLEPALALSAVCLVSLACSDPAELPFGGGGSTGVMTSGNGTGGGGGSASIGSGSGSSGIGSGGGSSVPMYAELWYSVDQLLVLIQLAASDGSVANVESSNITASVDVGQSAITMLNDGSLLLSRLSQADSQSYFFHIPDPPRDGSDVTPNALGTMPNGIMIEGLYTGCDGAVYAMDTGADDVSSDGNRLLRFTGDVISGDFAFAVVSDLATADVADIDDMSPAIVNNGIEDNPGLAIDTGDIHAFDFQTGSGTQIAQAGTYGIHALGNPLFDDDRSRLYVLDSSANLFEVDPVTFTPSQALVTGPTPANGTAGWSSLAGPLTDCVTGFDPPR